jgi:hypothetical protein
MKKVIFLLLDGARRDALENHIANGFMPNLKAITEDGGSFSTAVTVFPSTTGPAYLPFISGVFPGTSNLPGIRWFDKISFSKNINSLESHRSYVGVEGLLFNRDIKKSQPTIFEIVENSRSIFNEITRGLKSSFDMTKLSKAYYKLKSHFSGSNSIDDIAFSKLTKAINSGAQFIFCCFLGVDSNSHISGWNSKQVIDSYINFDYKLGLMMDELKDSNQLSETLLIITSDHGHSDTSNHIEIVDILTDAGYKVFSYPLIYKKYSEDVDAAVMVSGNSMSHIYLRKDGNWEKNFSFKDSEILIEKLLSFEGIDIVMAKNEKGQIVIRSKRGIALLEDKETGVFYTPLLNDPFGFTGIEDYISYDEVLDLTFDTKYPDSLTQIAQIFKSSRCGDIVISAESGYDLRKDFEVPEHKSSHGSLNSEHMHVPLVMNKKVTESKIRTVDLYPTILDYLGFPCPSKIDGKKLDIN